MFMKCSVHVYSLNLLYVTHPLFLKMPLLSLHSLQKVGYLARPDGGAVGKNRQLVNPVTTVINRLIFVFKCDPDYALIYC